MKSFIEEYWAGIVFGVNFITGALPGDNKTDDQFALEVLENTSIYHLGGNKYKVVTNGGNERRT